MAVLFGFLAVLTCLFVGYLWGFRDGQECGWNRGWNDKSEGIIKNPYE